MEYGDDEGRSGETRYIYTDVRRFRMRKNPVYILQSCARVVRSGGFLTYLIHHQTLRVHSLAS